jgi:hypothetical protein
MIKLYCATADALVVLTADGGQPRCDLLLKRSNIACVTVDPLRPQFIYCGTFVEHRARMTFPGPSRNEWFSKHPGGLCP